MIGTRRDSEGGWPATVWLKLVMAGGAFLVPDCAWSQVLLAPGEVAQAETQGGSEMSTWMIDLVPGEVSGLPSVFRFEIGFATSEGAGGGLHDGLSVTLTTTGDSPVAVLLAMDVFGLSLAPATPGALLVNPGSLSLGAGTPPLGFGSGRTLIGTHAIEYTVPPELTGQPLRAYFDLVDNGDSDFSVAYVTVPVPAPIPEAGWLGLGTALGMLGWIGVRASGKGRA